MFTIRFTTQLYTKYLLCSLIKIYQKSYSSSLVIKLKLSGRLLNSYVSLSYGHDYMKRTLKFP